MWFVVARTPMPDARYWPGRRLLAVADALAWPGVWVVLATQLPQSGGIAGPMIIGLAVLSAVGRARRATWHNHRYHFTTWRWGRIAFGLLLIAVVLKVAMLA